MKTLPALLALLLLPLAAAESHAALVPPAGYYQAAQPERGKASACPAAPRPFTGPLNFPSKYAGSDRARDALNTQAYASYSEITEQITLLESGFSRYVADYLRFGRPGYADCALDWLDEWASADALLSDEFTHTGKSRRKWTLGSLSSAYLRLKFSESQPLKNREAQAERIEAWLDALANRVLLDWQDQPRERINNHQYWAAWSLMATSVVLNRRDLYDWSIEQYRIAAHQVTEDGYLPNELHRRSRALTYHSYALGPLLMISAFALANGQDLRHENSDAIRRVAENTLASRENPARFAARANSEQVMDDLRKTNNLAWVEPYCALYSCAAPTRQWLESVRPLRTYRLGGDVSQLFSPTPQHNG
jgi:poly(beta-D-mannuronate) lyase